MMKMGLNMNMGLSSLSKNIGVVGEAVSSVGGAVGAGFHQLSASTSHGTTDDKEKERKKKVIAEVFALLENVQLQSPQTHSGIILAYTGSTLTPIIHQGVKFTWFRMGAASSEVELLEESSNVCENFLFN